MSLTARRSYYDVMTCLVAMLTQARNDVLTCLVTGNLEPIGWGKMRALGLLPYFSEPRFGGFGSDHCSGNTLESWRDREELVRIAAARAKSSAKGAHVRVTACKGWVMI